MEGTNKDFMFRLGADIGAVMVEQAKKNGINPTAMVRLALTQWIAKNVKPEKKKDIQ